MEQKDIEYLPEHDMVKLKVDECPLCFSKVKKPITVQYGNLMRFLSELDFKTEKFFGYQIERDDSVKVIKMPEDMLEIFKKFKKKMEE